jgi:CubicO group peptidase (beta-lactamase class C family)
MKTVAVTPPFLSKKRGAEFRNQIEIWAKFAKEEKMKECSVCVLKVLLVTLTLAVFGQTMEAAEEVYDAAAPSRNTAFLDSVVAYYMNGYHLPGLAGSVVKDGEIIWRNAYGWANRERQIPAADTTIWLIGSISKTVTAVAAMQAWEQGLYGLDDDINDYLPFEVNSPYFPDDSITNRMLLVHTSSIHVNYDLIDSLTVYTGDSPVPLDTFLYNYLNPNGYWYDPIENFNNHAPGTFFDYAGPGNCLAAYLTQVVTGDSFPVFTQQHIFEPLGMTRTAWFYADLDTNNIAMSYRYSGGQQIPFGFPGKPTYPGGNLKSSVIDLSRFLIAFMQYGRLDTTRILDSTTVHLMRTVQDTINAGLQQYIGITWWYWLSTSGRWCWGHAGGWEGYKSLMKFCPEENAGAIMMTNGEGMDLYEAGVMLDAFLDWAAQYGIAENTIKPAHIVRLQATPNPFTNEIEIRFMIHDSRSTNEADQNIRGSAGRVSDYQKPAIRIYDATGRLVKYFSLPNCDLLSSTSVVWDGRDDQNRMLDSGVYFVRLSVGDQTESKKILLVR